MQRPFKIGKKDSTIKINIIILNGLSEGKSTTEMAKTLNISERAVRARVERLMENNLSESKIHLVSRAIRENII